VKTKIVWLLVVLTGVVSFAMLALSRGETINAAWLVLAALCCFAIAYRFYSKFIAERVFELDDRRLTPAERNNDGLDYVPTNRVVVFGHHFAAIAGAGPLVGPILAAQMGFLPGTLWILVGVVLAGAVQDFLILFLSVRRDGRSLGEMAKQELGPTVGVILMVGVLGVMIILLSALALIVVKALAISPWGTFTIAATIPIALLMGIYMRFIRPGRIAEVSVIGFVLMMAAIVYGEDVAHSTYWGPLFTLNGEQLTLALVVYGFIASVLPVWLLLAPRDYLSTFLKLGVIGGLAIGVLFALPELRMPAITRFIDGTGPVFAGALFPFLFITIACGACSGFHALVASGTTPKLIERESHIRPIGYGAMLGEALVAIMAVICASVMEPGVYFAMNSPGALIGKTVETAAVVINGWGFMVTPEMLTQIAKDVGEQSILSRTGGAPTFAVGMAVIITDIFNSKAMMAFWYHFAILFEALFILTALDAGTRVCRFMVQDLAGVMVPKLGYSRSLAGNLVGTTVTVSAWGWFVYQGVTDPFGGINSLWPLFGISNQMLAGMALTLGTVVLFKMKKGRYAWVTLVPTTWLLVVTLTAGWEKVFSDNWKIGFLALARRFNEAAAQGTVLAPAKSLEEMGRVAFNNQVDAVLCAFFMIVAVTLLLAAIRAVILAIINPEVTTQEVPATYREASAYA
jgi:carbon starvation protein